MKRIIAISTAIAMLCLLVSCSDKNKEEKTGSERVMDITAVYGDFFDYTFDGDYKITLTEDGVLNEGTDNEQAYNLYNISYTRKDGVKRNIEIYSQEFTEQESKYYASEQRMMNEEVNALCIAEIQEACNKEFIDNILSKYIDIEYIEDEKSYKTDEYRCQFSLLTPMYLFNKEYEGYEKGCKIIDSHITPETGYKLSEIDLKTFAADREYYFQFTLSISPTADAELYIDKMNSIVEDYFAYTGNPLNAQFNLRQGELDKVSNDTLFQKTYIMGEEINFDEKKSENESFNLNNEIIRICIEEE